MVQLSYSYMTTGKTIALTRWTFVDKVMDVRVGPLRRLSHQRIDAFELWYWRLLKSPLDCKEIKPVKPKENQSWIFSGRTDAETEAPIFWLPDSKSQLIGKDPDAGKDWRQEEKGTTEDEIVGWHHQLNRHEFEQTPGGSEGQGSLGCCSPWGWKELNTTEWLTNKPGFKEKALNERLL